MNQIKYKVSIHVLTLISQVTASCGDPNFYEIIPKLHFYKFVLKINGTFQGIYLDLYFAKIT
jgi:hypothetical protein